MWRAPRVTLILIDIVKLLCAQKVDMCKEDQDGTAPAHIAAACGHLEVIQYLYEQGVSVKHLEASGFNLRV